MGITPGARRRTAAGPWRTVAALLLPWMLAGCAGAGRVDLWPIYFHETVRAASGPEGATESTTEVLWPFFERHVGPESTWHVVRPIYNIEGRADGSSELQYLWPFGWQTHPGPHEFRHRLFPFFGYHRTLNRTAGRNTVHAHLLQLIRWGSDARFGPYAAVFPLGGVTHGVLGDTWSFFLFPLLSHYAQGDYSRYDYPWPLLGHGGSPDGSQRALRVFPFYAWKRQRISGAVYERRDVMWPFVRWGRLDRGGQYYHRALAVTPFFSTVRTYDRQGALIAHRSSILGIGWTKDSRTQTPETQGWTALWSLLKSDTGPRMEEFRFIPFYWRTTFYASTEKDPARSWTRTRAPWPLVWVDSDRLQRGVTKHGYVVVPFYWHYTYITDPGTPSERVDRRVTIFPLLTWRQRGDGGFDFWIVSNGWSDLTKGFKRNYRAFFDFFQYHREPDDTRETRVLWRLYHHKRGPGGRYLSIVGLFTYDGRHEAIGDPDTYVSLLFGLVKRTWSERGGRWRLFYIPLGGGRAEGGDG